MSFTLPSCSVRYLIFVTLILKLVFRPSHADRMEAPPTMLSHKVRDPPAGRCRLHAARDASINQRESWDYGAAVKRHQPPMSQRKTDVVVLRCQ